MYVVETVGENAIFCPITMLFRYCSTENFITFPVSVISYLSMQERRKKESKFLFQ